MSITAMSSSAFLTSRLLVGDGQLAGRADLVRPVQRVEQQTLLVQREAAEVLSVTQCDLPDRHFAGLLERLAEQRVRLGADGFRLEVVRALQVDAGLDLGVRAELDDVDRCASS